MRVSIPIACVLVAAWALSTRPSSTGACSPGYFAQRLSEPIVRRTARFAGPPSVRDAAYVVSEKAPIEGEGCGGSAPYPCPILRLDLWVDTPTTALLLLEADGTRILVPRGGAGSVDEPYRAGLGDLGRQHTVMQVSFVAPDGSQSASSTVTVSGETRRELVP